MISFSLTCNECINSFDLILILEYPYILLYKSYNKLFILLVLYASIR